MSENLIDVTLEGGKYRVLMGKDGNLKALRHGEEWRDLCGDNLVYYLANEVQELRKDAERWRALLDSQRIRVLGSAGLGSKDYQHFGAEFWSTFPDVPEGESDYGKHVLTTYVDSITSDNI